MVTDHKPQNLSHLALTNDVNLMAWEEMRQGMDLEHAEAYKDVLRRFGEENRVAKNGVAMSMEKWIVVGRKQIEER